MIATLRGKALGFAESTVIVDVNGVGFAVTTTPEVRNTIDIGNDVFLHTSLVVREDSFTLFGYETALERDLFLLLQTVSGIGPKVSHAILSSLSIEEITHSIAAGEAKTLEKVSGLGKKGAQRIILELREKISQFGAPTQKRESTQTPGALSLTEALTGLGFTAKEIDHALEIVQGSQAKSIEEKLKVALTALQGRGSRV